MDCGERYGRWYTFTLEQKSCAHIGGKTPGDTYFPGDAGRQFYIPEGSGVGCRILHESVSDSFLGR